MQRKVDRVVPFRQQTPARHQPPPRLQAAATLRRCREVLAARGATIITELLGGDEPADWMHYPDGDVYDAVSQAQFFYHRHSPEEAGAGAAEHGHFHLFLGADGMPAGVTPLMLPENAVANVRIPPQAAPLRHGDRDEVSHLVAIALDARGEPVRLFTTNQWVTGETWYRAEDVIRMLDGFSVKGAMPATLLNRWIEAVIALFRPQIAVLLQDRDEKVMAWRRLRRVPVWEDQRLEIPSSLPIDLDAELAAVEHVAAEPAGAARLPRMAEGWGS